MLAKTAHKATNRGARETIYTGTILVDNGELSYKLVLMVAITIPAKVETAHKTTNRDAWETIYTGITLADNRVHIFKHALMVAIIIPARIIPAHTTQPKDVSETICTGMILAVCNRIILETAIITTTTTIVTVTAHITLISFAREIIFTGTILAEPSKTYIILVEADKLANTDNVQAIFSR